MKQTTTTLFLVIILVTSLSAQQGSRTRQLIEEGKKYYKVKKYNVAKQYFDLALELEPENSTCLAHNALIAYKGQNDSTALELIQKAIDSRPDHPYYYSMKADICNHFEKYEQAIEACNAALEINTELKEAYGNRSVAYWNMGFKDQAHLDLDRVIELSGGDDAKAYHNKAVYFKDEKKYQEALTYYTKAIEIKADYGFAYYNRGKLYVMLGNQLDACRDFRTAVGYGLSPNQEKAANKYIEEANCLIKGQD